MTSWRHVSQRTGKPVLFRYWTIMKTKKIVIDGKQQSLSKATVDDRAEGWFKVVSQQWHANIYLFVGSVEDCVKSGRERFKDNPDIVAEIEQFAVVHAEAHANARWTSKNDFIIRMGSYRPCLMDDQLTLCHECLHVAQILLFNICAEVNPAGSETLAYTHEFAMSSVAA